jgi:hypothetical protein
MGEPERRRHIVPGPRSACGTLGRRTTARSASLIGSVVLAALSAVHLYWATGSTWPARDEARLADTVAGLRQMPGTRPCLVVGLGLGLASAVVSGFGGNHRLARLARLGVASGFIVRGAAGSTGNTSRLVPWEPSARFVGLDRRCCGPPCLFIGVAAGTSISRPSV